MSRHEREREERGREGEGEERGRRGGGEGERGGERERGRERERTTSRQMDRHRNKGQCYWKSSSQLVLINIFLLFVDRIILRMFTTCGHCVVIRTFLNQQLHGEF